MRGGRQGATAAHELAREGSTGVWAQGTGIECTSNISAMTLTLDVSKFTGWLKAFASCRVKRGGVRCGEVAEGRQPRAGPRVQRAREG